MEKNHFEKEPRYTLRTLTALYDGSVRGRLSARGVLRVTITDEDNNTFTAHVLSFNDTRLAVRADDGSVHRDIKPMCVDHAEVV